MKPHEKVCARCGAVFDARPQVKRKKYCSKRCLWAAKNNSDAKTRWLEKHSGKLADQRQARYAERRDELKEKMRARYWSNRDQFLEQMRVKYQETRTKTPWRTLLMGAKSRAKAKRLPFSLTEEWARERWTGLCEITEIPFVIGAAKNSLRTFWPTIDKIEPSLGYVPSNCRFVIWAVNALKGEGTDADMLRVATLIVARLRTRPP